MKRILYVLICAVVFLAGCEKDSVKLRVRIDNFENNAKVFMNGSTPFWHSIDTLNVNGSMAILSANSSGTSGQVTVPTSNLYMAVYPYSCVESMRGAAVSLSTPRLQAYVIREGKQVVEAPMCALSQPTSSSATLNFKNIGALLAVEITNNVTDRDGLVVDSISVKSLNSAIALWGEGRISDSTSDAPYLCLTSEASSHDSIVLAKGLHIGLGITLSSNSNTMVYVHVPAVERMDVDNRFAIRVFAHIGSTKYNYLLEQQNACSGNIRRNNIAIVPFATAVAHEAVATTLPEGALSGEFSVSATKKVYFSKGNLQYRNTGTHTTATSTGVTGEWRFADDQLTLIGTGNVMSDLNHNWIDIFCYGTSGYCGLNPLLSINYYSSAINGTYYDWGLFNAISNGGNTPGLWRTLTSEEWAYLFNQARSSFRYVGATIGNLNGLIIFPDNYTHPSGASTLTNINSTNHLNAISEASWALIEEAGAVFLPTTGEYSVSNTTIGAVTCQNPNIYGEYWTSSFTSNPIMFRFETNNQRLAIPTCVNSTLLPVRLVQDVPSK